MLKIRVYEGDLEKPKVNVNIPLHLAKWAMKFIPESAKAKIGEKDIDIDEIAELIEEGVGGKLVEVEDEKKGERVEIFIA